MKIFVLHFRHYLWQYYINHSKKKVSVKQKNTDRMGSNAW